jgi:hypothetical protein
MEAVGGDLCQLANAVDRVLIQYPDIPLELACPPVFIDRLQRDVHQLLHWMYAFYKVANENMDPLLSATGCAQQVVDNKLAELTANYLSWKFAGFLEKQDKKNAPFPR